MKYRIVVIYFALCFTTLSMAQNPIIQTNFTADPAAMVHNDKVYLYTGHDLDTATYFRMYDWLVYSTEDMVNWTDHGAALTLETFNWALEDAWAAHTIERNGKFYWYVTVTPKERDGRAIGVAVSDCPTGPFVDALGEPLIRGDWAYIDPAAFIDDDGQAYLYWGNPDLYYAKLNEDMVSYDKNFGIVQAELTQDAFGKGSGDRATSYVEGPWVHKRNQIYYLLYAAGGIPEHLAYSTSHSPIGPWSYGDTIMPVIQNGGAFTNHPAIIEFKERNFLFYHNAALPGGSGFRRSVCVEEFSFNPDGSIPRIMDTKEGVLTAVKNLNPYLRNEAETIAWSEGLKTAGCEHVGMFVTNINNNNFIKVRSVDFQEGSKSFIASVASGSDGGSIEIRLGGLNGQLIGTCKVENTGGWNEWQTVKCNTTNVGGVHDLYFVFKGGDGDLFNFDWWMFNINN